jgi:transcriptional regulator with XRE-family HTH domain
MSSTFKKLLERAKTRDPFWVETAILEITEEIVARMEADGVSRTELAKRLGKKPSFVTKILRGDNNFTLETLVKVARRLNCRFLTHLQCDGVTTEWIDFLHTKPAISVSQPSEPLLWSENYVSKTASGSELLLNSGSFVNNDAKTSKVAIYGL